MKLKTVIQGVAALCIGAGVFLFYSGSSLMPDELLPDEYPNSMFKDRAEQETIAIACRGVGLGLGVFGIVVVGLSLANRQPSAHPDT